MNLTRWTFLIFTLIFAPITSAMEIYDSEDEGFNYIMADGEINTRDAKTLKLRLSKHTTDGLPSAIFFSSPGGILEMTPNIANVIISESNRLFQETGKYNIFVINSECSSACTVLTTILTNKRDPRALKIWVTPGSTFGFHSPVEKKKNAVAEIADVGEREAKIRKQLSYYQNNGIDPVWLQNNELIFKNSEMTDFTAQQLCSDRSLVIPTDSCLPTDADVVPLVENILRDADFVKKNNAPTGSAKVGKSTPARKAKPKAASEGQSTVPAASPLLNFFKKMLGAS